MKVGESQAERRSFWNRDPFQVQMGCLTALLWAGGLYYGAGLLLLVFGRGANAFTASVYFLAPFVWPLAICLYPFVRSFSVLAGVISFSSILIACWLFFGAKTIRAFLVSVFLFLLVFAASMLALVRYGNLLSQTGL